MTTRMGERSRCGLWIRNADFLLTGCLPTPAVVAFLSAPVSEIFWPMRVDHLVPPRAERVMLRGLGRMIDLADVLEVEVSARQLVVG